jgi:serine/threonine protein kinase
MDLSVQNVYGLLIRSRLLPLDDARKMYERWQAESKNFNDAGAFAKWMVANRFLTQYQAGLLARGHADHFYVGEYKVLDRIGMGRMAGVYKAVHPLGQTVAIKVLPPSRAKESRALRRFEREATMAMKLKHPHVVRTFQIGNANGLHFLVMEYLEGETLEELMARRGKLPPAEAVRLTYQALTGLQHLHEQGFVHRDMKPGNLMLVPGRIAGQPDTTLRSTVKILDIGLARPKRDGGLFDPRHDPGLTSEGTLLGTPNYMAPEQARDARNADIRADIYSLGCVLYHALTGQPPFPDSNIINQMIRHATEMPQPIKELNPAVPDGLQQIINPMLAKDPAKRYSTPGQAAQALQSFLVAGSEPASADQDSKLRSYLTWLEKEGGSKSSQKPIAVAQPAVATADPTIRRKQKRPRVKTAVSAPAAPPIALPVKEFDVELVPIPAPIVAPAARSSQGLCRRDFIAFGVGAGSVLLAILIGWLTAVLLRPNAAEDEKR